MARTEVMEELDSCIKEWLNETINYAFNKENNSDLLKFWLNRLVSYDNESAIYNCTAYVEQFGWNDLNSSDYKYFDTDTLEDVVARKISRIANNHLIALG